MEKTTHQGSSGSSNTSRASRFRHSIEIRECQNCGNEMYIRTSWTDRNPGRRFWQCLDLSKQSITTGNSGGLANHRPPPLTGRPDPTGANLGRHSRQARPDLLSLAWHALAGRSESTTGEYLGYNYADFGFLSYGTYWRKIRKLVLSEVLSAWRLEKFSHTRVSEVEICIRELHSAVIAAQSPATGEAMINISHWLEKLTLNLMVKMIAGKRYKTEGVEDEELN
nr:cytochrome P450 82C4-like [Ipomoea batatas]